MFNLTLVTTPFLEQIGTIRKPNSREKNAIVPYRRHRRWPRRARRGLRWLKGRPPWRLGAAALSTPRGRCCSRAPSPAPPRARPAAGRLY